MKNQIVVPTGYMGSGSSAITDLISEIEGYYSENGSYEYILMHCPDGIFDLEDKLLNGNNCIRSDEAIHRFQICMNELYQKKFYWPGGYQKKISEDFIIYCCNFIQNLNPIEIRDTYWYFQEKPSGIKMYMVHVLRKLFKKLGFYKTLINVPLQYQNMQVVIPDEKKFFHEARVLLENIYNDLGYASKNLILDQFLLPHNLFRIKNYFDDSLRVFVVDRDPRDVFILNKYFWKEQKCPVPYPLQVDEFCRMYKAVRESERIVSDTRILRLHFEDLVFNYEQVLSKIYLFLGIEAEAHEKYKRTKFNPDISVNNTMLFKKGEFDFQEMNVIEKKLSDYLYDFPDKYKFKNKKTNIF